MSEDKNNPRRGEMAFVELPGKGKFFLHNRTSRDHYGFNGSLWIVGSEAEDKLKKDGINAILEDPESERSAAVFIVATERTEDRPGLAIDFYNNPQFEGESDLKWERSNRAEGIVDRLVDAQKTDPFLGSVREMIRSIIQAKVHDVRKTSDIFTITNIFFDNPVNPEGVIRTVFGGYDYTVTKSED